MSAALTGRAAALSGRMPEKAKRDEICDASDSRKKEIRIAH